MNDSYKNYTPHCGVITVKTSGKVSYTDNSNGNSPKGVATTNYDSLQGFQNDYGYNKFYYSSVRKR